MTKTAIPPFVFTAAELAQYLSDDPRPMTFRRRHVIDTGEGHFTCEQIRHCRTLASWKRDPVTKQMVQVI